jgi:hypothetical protein
MNMAGDTIPWAIPNRIAPSIPCNVLENRPITTTDMWAIDE